MSLFPEPDLAPQAARLIPKLHALAAEGIYFGTSSWKYEVQNSIRIPHLRLVAVTPKGYYVARDAKSKFPHGFVIIHATTCGLDRKID
jgi:hypothetical protein